MTKPSLSQQIDAVFGMTASLRTQVKAGQAPDIAGLQTRIQEICEAAAQAPANDRPALHKTLSNLLAEMDQLHQDFSQLSGALSEELKILNQQRHALTAYGKPKK